ncbi:auxin-binding protein T85 isoform X2 [Physcomitrium patens]|uniref:Cupin 2 conserved barrel domain-containing protein n=1 Tax=Physcomitrium patens TaxID=3218 RepID=A0A7I4DGX0_PHYPA|nr:auxin-binding protein T85-like [Physcomitrium patens]XP_024374525.1 auxin-binding protein T85-like isoform X2 [Physcomitrium patens]|eukprot:XP_024372426.1 auxin-binding protein T85-like [Physcomitrella patens]
MTRVWRCLCLCGEQEQLCRNTFVSIVRRSALGRKFVRNLTELGQDSYGRPGLMHMTIAGAVHHGMKEMEVWMQTFAPNSGTPIHRHECEEVFITLKGHGTLYLSRSRELDAPGEPEEFQIYPNATFTIPVDSVHQVRNTNQGEDLQVVVTISRPPMKSFIYKEWSTPHAEAVYEPREWDKEDKLSSASQQCKEPEAEDDVMADIAKLLGRSIEDIVVSDEIR